MFSYYGSKSKIVKLYPPPRFDVIVEPFAGSARYSLHYFEKDVYLYDTSEYVVKVWQYLIAASEKDILSLPDIPSKVSLDDYKQLSEAERYLIGFSLCRGKAKPRKVGHGQNSWNRDKIRIANSLYKIKHWRVEQKSYSFAPWITATHFIDPPYQSINGKENSDRYEHDALDYRTLGVWCSARKGQVIVCENDKATWLPFKHLITVNANTNNSFVKTNAECVYLQG